MKLSTSSQMKELDAKSIKEFNIPDIVLMENASRGAFELIKKHFGKLEGIKVSVFAGLGNNGGDAMALAKHLYNAGANVLVNLAANPQKLNPSPKINYEILRSMNVEIAIINNVDDINDVFLAHSLIIIDGLFGIGLSRNIEGLFYDIVAKINNSNAYKVSLDIPSGINADTAECLGIAVKADLTVTFALAKPGHFLYPGRDYCGRLEIVDISTPKNLIYEFKPTFSALVKNDFSLEDRPKNSHKGNFGHVAIVGGSIGKSGAVVLSSCASIKSGVGLSSAVIPDCINTAFESLCIEAMSYPVNSKDGFFSKDSFGDMLEFVKDKDVICFGMGLGVFDEGLDLLKGLIDLKKPMVIDADGLNVLSKKPDILKTASAPIILTPHPKEFSRLIGQPTQYVIKNRLNLIKEFAKNYNVILVLKMADTLISDGESIFINTSGNPGLSTGGSGDVLSGIIASFLAQGKEALEAATFGVFLHGFSADLAVKEFGENALLASDVINYLAKAIESFKITAR
ncbi:NAD(P)HX epimerase / NAD(P)HX dehydratase [Desulfurella amilsii]|uniref:Bifunctional NAD(P)H-hydrate repair enzyme n=1 Tax=Desulfurella amilsii TaxID=1562698 RepID=A0A1X4XUS7_9BACT|nr:NAD(P)H-hydrate dehydratase [Desulfurella amilsii]OSS41281.1 NAD(P)HX epimerase / NAD(P)HX dehydratase [Desulfurella amilsii]